MKEIKGKRYYVSLGYVDKENFENGINVKDIMSIFMDTEDNSVMYIDDTDKDNVISLPLVPVNDIQRKGNEYIFSIHVNPLKIKFPIDQEFLKLNVIGLFSVYKSDNVQYIKHVSFFETMTEFLNNKSKFLNIALHVNTDKILGE